MPVASILAATLEKLPSPAAPTSSGDGILFSGNHHDTVPRALLTDPRLTPLERNTWQVFRLLLNEDRVTAFPTYEQLRPYLTSMPCAGQASDETIARALILLRLTRWLTLARHRRHPISGRIEGNLYVLHDEPLTPYESIQLDPRYLELVSQSLTHASKAIQRVGHHTLKEISEDPLLSGRVLPSRLELVMQRLAQRPWKDVLAPSSESEEGERDVCAPSSESEDGKNTGNSRLRNPKTDRTVRTDSIYKDLRTVPRACEGESLRLPARFRALRTEQQSGALTALSQVESDLRQAVLDEWAARCEASTVRNPAGYLFGIIQKALRGEFRAWKSQRPGE